MTHRILVFGGRGYHDAPAVSRVLTELRDVVLDGEAMAVIEGGAAGADRLGRNWARANGIPVLTVEANWNFYGKRAGHMRNGWMVDLGRPTYGVAFPGGPGTADMARQLANAGITVWAPFGLTL